MKYLLILLFPLFFLFCTNSTSLPPVDTIQHNQRELSKKAVIDLVFEKVLKNSFYFKRVLLKQELLPAGYTVYDEAGESIYTTTQKEWFLFVNNRVDIKFPHRESHYVFVQQDSTIILRDSQWRPDQYGEMERLNFPITISYDSACSIIRSQYPDKSLERWGLSERILEGSLMKTLDSSVTYRLNTCGWFFFIDLHPQKRFYHPVEYVIVDSHDGKLEVIKENYLPYVRYSMKLVTNK